MTRVQRNKIRKKRKRFVIFSSLICLGVFILGLVITHNVMTKLVALPANKGLFGIEKFVDGFFLILLKLIKELSGKI